MKRLLFALQARRISAAAITVAVASVVDAFSIHGSIQFVVACVALVGLAVMMEPR